MVNWTSKQFSHTRNNQAWAEAQAFGFFAGKERKEMDFVVNSVG
jgi:hypothetical protein